MGRLRVAVAGPDAAARTGHGRVWERGPAELSGITRIVRRRPDAWLADGHSPLPRTDRPIVAVLHEAPWDDPRTTAHLASGFVAEMRARHAETVARAARIVVPCEAARALVEHPAVDVVPYGVDADVFRPRGERGAHALFVGAAHPRKNLPALAQACASVGVELRAVLGPPPDRPDAAQLLEAALALPLTRLEASDDEALAAEMARAAVLCLPSFSEGFGLPVLEAMACGTPVVVGNGGALPEVAGDAGVVVEPSAEGIAAGLRRALADPGLGARGRERALTLPWRRTARGWLEALARAVESAS